MRVKLIALAGMIALISVVVTSATASTQATATPAAPAATAKIKIGYINLSDAIPFVVLVRKNVQAAAKKNGVDLVVCDPNLDAQKAIDCARQFKTQKVQGIINFQAVEAAGPRVCAAGPKVPVIAIDIHQRPCETVFYGANNFQAGKLAGVELGKFAKAKWGCKIDAYISMEAPAVGKVNNERSTGFFSGYRSICGAMKPTRLDGKGTTDGAIQPFRDTLTRLPGKSRILVSSLNDDMAIGAIKAAQSVGRTADIYTAGQGADPTSFPYMCGKTSFKNWVADTAYFPERYGDVTVPALVSLIQGQALPKVIYTNHRVITPATIRQVYPNACK